MKIDKWVRQIEKTFHFSKIKNFWEKNKKLLGEKQKMIDGIVQVVL